MALPGFTNPFEGLNAGDPYGVSYRMADGRFFVPYVDQVGGYQVDEFGQPMLAPGQSVPQQLQVGSSGGNSRWYVTNPGAGSAFDLNGRSGLVFDQLPELRNSPIQHGSFLGETLDNFMGGPGLVLGTGLGISGLVNGGFGHLFNGLGEAGGAMDMGVGGVGEAMGLGNGYTSPALFTEAGVPGDAYLPGGLYSGGAANPVPGDAFMPGALAGEAGAGTAAGVPVTGTSFWDALTGGYNPLTGNGLGGLGSVLDRANGGNGGGRNMWGDLISGLLGAYGANQQGDALRELAGQMRADRQPFLDASLRWLNDPAGYASGPGQTMMNSVLRSLSATHGNPADNPTSQALATEAGLRDWRSAVTGFGNLGLSGEDTRASIGSQAIGADAGILNSLGYAADRIFNPPNTLDDIIRRFGRGGMNLNFGTGV